MSISYPTTMFLKVVVLIPGTIIGRVDAYFMDVPKLYIPPKKYTDESSVVSMRLPKDMVSEIDCFRQDKNTAKGGEKYSTLSAPFS